MQKNRKTVGLALGGGGARGCAHLGVIWALQEAGIPIDAVAGTSIGALVGAFLASGDLKVLEEKLRQDKWQTILSYFDPVLSRQGFINGKKIEQLIEKNLSHALLEKMPIPYTAVATDLETGKEVWLQKGSAAQAIRASIALPIVFTPVQKGAQLLADGGIVNPLPVNVLKALRVDVVVAVDLNHAFIQERLKYNRRQRKLRQKNILELPKKKPNWLDITESTIFTTQNQLTEKNLQLYPPEVLIRPELNYAHLFDFKRAAELMEEGYRVTQKCLPQLRKLLS